MQNLQEEMSVHPEGAKWLSWSLEQVALILGRRFPGRTIWVVRASSMYLHTFSSYQNFVEGNLFGAPEHRPYTHDSGAFQHIRCAVIFFLKAISSKPLQKHVFWNSYTMFPCWKNIICHL